MTQHELVPPLSSPRSLATAPIPSDKQCATWWHRHGMLEHIKRHSQCVADIATALARCAVRSHPELTGAMPVDDWVQTIRVAGLLHDLGKTYTIQHGGSHSLLGASWVMTLTGNPHIAQGIIHHVHWPGALDPEAVFLPLAIVYSDKRVMHDTIVSLEQRFSDLLDRYGHTERSRAAITHTFEQARELETILSTFLGEDLHAYCTHCRRLVS
ncbi:HDIG domain-containing protein [Desulfovibrionales bacterium]